MKRPVSFKIDTELHDAALALLASSKVKYRSFTNIVEQALLRFLEQEQKPKKMKAYQTTTTGTTAMLLQHCGDYAGKYQVEALDLLDNEEGLAGNEWADIMYDTRTHMVYAVWANDSLDSFNGELRYLRLEEEDCPAAFAGMREQIEN